jgi:hypothetical protein
VPSIVVEKNATKNERKHTYFFFFGLILIPLFKNSLKNSKISSGNSCTYCINNVTLPVTNTSTDTPCPEAKRLVTTISVTSETTNSNSLLPNTASNDIQQHVYSANIDDVENVSKSDCHSDSDSYAPEVMVPDARVFSSIKNEQKYPWLYDNSLKKIKNFK